MSYVRIFFLIAINALRAYQSNLYEKFEKILPELKYLAKYYIYFYAASNILLLGIILLLDPSQNVHIHRILNDYKWEILIAKYLMELFVIINLLRFEVPKGFKKVYGLIPSIFYVITANFKNVYTWILIQFIYYTFLDKQLFLILFILSCIIIYLSLFAKISEFQYILNILKMARLMFVILLSYQIIQEVSQKAGFSFASASNKIEVLLFLWVAFLLILLISNYFLLRYIKATTRIFQEKQLIHYFKLFFIPFIFLTLIQITSSLFVFISNIEESLIIISYLISSLFVKIKFIDFLTMETYGYYLFYLKSLDKKIQSEFMMNINLNNFFLLLPVLLFHLCYLILNQQYIYAFLLMLVYILDIKADELIILITRKILKKSELPNLFIHTKKGLSNVLLIAFVPSAIISILVNSSSIKSSSLATTMLLLVSVILFCVSILAHYWRKSFFDELHK